MTLNYECEYEKEFPFQPQKLAEQVFLFTMDYLECPYEAEVNVLVTDDLAIREINQEQRGIDRATDVLSFPTAEYEVPGGFDILESAKDCFHPETGELLLGDIVISGDRVWEQAESYGHSVEREFAFLVVHSLLHLTGYDHMGEAEAAVMEKTQADILECLGIKR